MGTGRRLLAATGMQLDLHKRCAARPSLQTPPAFSMLLLVLLLLSTALPASSAAESAGRQTRKVQRYVCLRTPPALEALAASKAKRGGTRYEFTSASNLETMHEQHILKALVGLRGQCYTWDGGYWKYELCPMRQIRQLHYEGKEIASEIDLGEYVA